MGLTAIFLLGLLLIVMGSVPAWPYSRKWGHGPSGLFGVVLVVVLVQFLMGSI